MSHCTPPGTPLFDLLLDGIPDDTNLNHPLFLAAFYDGAGLILGKSVSALHWLDRKLMSAGDGFFFIHPSCCIRTENGGDFIAHAAENSELFFLGACGVCGVIEREMVAVHLAREERASLIRVSADGDHGFDILIEELIEVL